MVSELLRPGGWYDGGTCWWQSTREGTLISVSRSVASFEPVYDRLDLLAAPADQDTGYDAGAHAPSSSRCVVHLILTLHALQLPPLRQNRSACSNK